jgi:hypothetical protein
MTADGLISGAAQFLLWAVAVGCGFAGGYLVLLSLSPQPQVNWLGTGLLIAGCVAGTALFGAAAARLGRDAVEGQLLAIAAASALGGLAVATYYVLVLLAALGVVAAAAALLYPLSYRKLVGVGAYSILPEIFWPELQKLTGTVGDLLTHVAVMLLWPLVLLVDLPGDRAGYFAGIAGSAAISLLMLAAFAWRRMRSLPPPA